VLKLIFKLSSNTIKTNKQHYIYFDERYKWSKYNFLKIPFIFFRKLLWIVSRYCNKCYATYAQ